MIYTWPKRFFFQKYSVWRFKYTWHVTLTGLLILSLNFTPASCFPLSIKADDISWFFCCSFCLCYHYFCSIYNLLCMLSPSLCLSYVLPHWTLVFFSESLSFYRRLTFYMYHHQARNAFLLVEKLINHSSFAVTFISLAFLNSIQMLKVYNLFLFTRYTSFSLLYLTLFLVLER